jgi:hypothetical protein
MFALSTDFVGHNDGKVGSPRLNANSTASQRANRKPIDLTAPDRKFHS